MHRDIVGDYMSYGVRQAPLGVVYSVQVGSATSGGVVLQGPGTGINISNTGVLTPGGCTVVTGPGTFGLTRSERTVYVNCNGGAVTLQLPAAPLLGETYCIWRADVLPANTCSIVPQGGLNVSGLSSYPLFPIQSYILTYTGGNVWQISGESCSNWIPFTPSFVANGGTMVITTNTVSEYRADRNSVEVNCAWTVTCTGSVTRVDLALPIAAATITNNLIYHTLPSGSVAATSAVNGSTYYIYSFIGTSTPFPAVAGINIGFRVRYHMVGTN
jgi:hypothetical protein